MNPDDFSAGDAGALGAVFNDISRTVETVQGFGETVAKATVVDMTSAMIWAIILIYAFNSARALLMPWNKTIHDRWRRHHKLDPGGDP